MCFEYILEYTSRFIRTSDLHLRAPPGPCRIPRVCRRRATSHDRVSSFSAPAEAGRKGQEGRTGRRPCR